MSELLSQVVVWKWPIHECTEIAISKDIRLFYKPHDNEDEFPGFSAKAIKWVSCTTWPFDLGDPEQKVNVFAEVWALWDGVQYTIVGHNESGDVSGHQMAKVFSEIANLEARYCAEWESAE